jgi:CxxC motif-containing protein
MLNDEKEDVEVTCIQCPMGCKIIVDIYKQEIAGTKNAGCNRGIEYAIKEIKSPVRDFFSTIKVNNGKPPCYQSVQRTSSQSSSSMRHRNLQR